MTAKGIASVHQYTAISNSIYRQLHAYNIYSCTSTRELWLTGLFLPQPVFLAWFAGNDGSILNGFQSKAKRWCTLVVWQFGEKGAKCF